MTGEEKQDIFQATKEIKSVLSCGSYINADVVRDVSYQLKKITTIVAKEWPEE